MSLGRYQRAPSVHDVFVESPSQKMELMLYSEAEWMLCAIKRVV